MKTQSNTTEMHVHNHRIYGSKSTITTATSKFDFNKKPEMDAALKGENVAYVYEWKSFPGLFKVFFSSNIKGYLNTASSYIPSTEGKVLFDMGPFPQDNKKIGTTLNVGLAGVGVLPLNNLSSGNWYKLEDLETVKEALTALQVEEDLS